MRAEHPAHLALARRLARLVALGLMGLIAPLMGYAAGQTSVSLLEPVGPGEGTPPTDTSAPTLAPRSYDQRGDGALRVSDVRAGSAQNPTFSPDGTRIIYTRFLNGYNEGPAELVGLDLRTGQEAIVVPADRWNKVMSPSGGWVGSRITYSSDEQGPDEVFIANENGTGRERVTERYRGANSIEPVLHPRNVQKIVFEVAPADRRRPHHLAIVELDLRRRITDLTSDPSYDDRLPAFSPDGERVLFQRTETGADRWQIYAARLELEPRPSLVDVQRISPSWEANYTDNAWGHDGRYVLSSTNHGGLGLPNIVAIAADGSGASVQITSSPNREDGAPSASPDGRWVAFESHFDEDADSPTQIWLIPSPIPSEAPVTEPPPAVGN